MLRPLTGENWGRFPMGAPIKSTTYKNFPVGLSNFCQYTGAHFGGRRWDARRGIGPLLGAPAQTKKPLSRLAAGVAVSKYGVGAFMNIHDESGVGRFDLARLADCLIRVRAPTKRIVDRSGAGALESDRAVCAKCGADGGLGGRYQPETVA